MTQIKINHKYELLLVLLKHEMHQRELAKVLNTSLTKVQSILKELQESNVVDYKIEGKNYKYKIKSNLISKTEIINAENYKLKKLLLKHKELEPVFQDIIKQSKSNLIILFGSYAKNKEKTNSDIDVYIEGKEQTLNHIHPDLSIKTGKFNINDLLIKEIIKNHIIIKGVEEYYEKIGFFD